MTVSFSTSSGTLSASSALSNDQGLATTSLSTTQAYTAVDAARLMEVYEKAHPRA